MRDWLVACVLVAGCATDPESTPPPAPPGEAVPPGQVVPEDRPPVARVVQAKVFGPFDSGEGTTLAFSTAHPGDSMLFMLAWNGDDVPMVEVGDRLAYQFGVAGHNCAVGGRMVIALALDAAPAGDLFVYHDVHGVVIAAIEIAGTVAQRPAQYAQDDGDAGKQPQVAVATEPGDFVVTSLASCGAASMLVGPFTALPAVDGVVTGYAEADGSAQVGADWDVGGNGWAAVTAAYR